jgi:hypothetical protein
LLLLGGGSPVVSAALFLFFFPSNGLLIRLSFFGRPALRAPANGGLMMHLVLPVGQTTATLVFVFS